jgi:hypothetical protein
VVKGGGGGARWKREVAQLEFFFFEIRGCRRWSCCVTGARPLGRRCCSWSAVDGGRGKMEMERERVG